MTLAFMNYQQLYRNSILCFFNSFPAEISVKYNGI